jgi:hypothetical protein
VITLGQLDGNVYVMLAVPGETAVTKPDAEPIVATAGLLLLQDPPVIMFVSVVVSPLHNTNVPVIGGTSGLMVTTSVT